MKQYNFKDFCKMLGKNGYSLARINGSHHIYKNNDKTIVVNKDLNRMVCRRLIKDYGLVC